MKLVIDETLRTFYHEDAASLFFDNGEIWTTNFNAPRLKPLIDYIRTTADLEEGQFFGKTPFVKKVEASVLDAYRSNLHSINKDNIEEEDNSDVKDRLWFIMQEAVNHGSSDIHIEVYRHQTELYCRVDGNRIPIGKPIPDPNYGRTLLSVVFMDVAIDKDDDYVEGIPNAGRIEHSLKVKGIMRNTIWRASSMPAKDRGGKLSLRWINKEEEIPDINQLGYTQGHVDQFTNFIRRSKGLLLVSGVVNSGKTTLIASLIKLSKTLYPGRSHHTLEDPPEFDLGVIQTHVRPNQKVSDKSDEYLDFRFFGKVMLRQDPDVVSYGELRGHDVAMQACRMGDTGQLVLGTLHTSNAVGIAGTMIKQFKVDAAVVAAPDLMCLWVTQTLVRTLCPHCKISHENAAEYYHSISNDEEYLRGLSTLKEHIKEDTFFAPVYWRNHSGCEHCEKGEKGLTAILEMIVFDDEDRRFIVNNDYLGWEDALKRKGYQELKDHALTKIQQGMIDINTATDRIPTLKTTDTHTVYHSLLEHHDAHQHAPDTEKNTSASTQKADPVTA